MQPELQRALYGETTMRDRWTCFYRLYRMAKKAYDFPQDQDVTLCLRVLLPNTGPGFIGLVTEEVRGATRSHWPLFLRRRFLEIERRKRLYGKHYEMLETAQFVARKLAESGCEMTPDEVAETRIEITRKIRAYAAEKGIELPLDDVELFRCTKRDT